MNQISHAASVSPRIGLCNRKKPSNGQKSYLKSRRMNRRPKFISQEIRERVAANVRERMKVVLKDQSAPVDMLAKRTQLSRSTIQRVMNADIGASVDVLAVLAMGLGCDFADLCAPLK